VFSSPMTEQFCNDELHFEDVVPSSAEEPERTQLRQRISLAEKIYFLLVFQSTYTQSADDEETLRRYIDATSSRNLT
jgi:hypothetical protein